MVNPYHLCINHDFFFFIYINDMNEDYKNNEIEINSINSKILSNNKFINMNNIWKNELIILEKKLKKFEKNEKICFTTVNARNKKNCFKQWG